MTAPSDRFPAPIEATDRHLHKNLGVATDMLTAEANKILSEGGRAVEVRPPDWDALRARLEDALDRGEPPPLQARMYLAPLLALSASRSGTEASTNLAERVARHYAERRRAPLSKLAPLVEWAPHAPAVQRLWRQTTSPPVRPSARPRLSDWLRSLPRSLSVVQGLADVVQQADFGPALPSPLVDPQLTPLAEAVWTTSLSDDVDGWLDRSDDELAWFLDEPSRATAFVHPIADLLLAPMARDLDRVRKEVAQDGPWGRRVSLIGSRLPKSGSHLDTSKLGDPAREVIEVWRLAKALAELFATAWEDDVSGNGRRKFWKDLEARIHQVERFGGGPWFALRLGQVWFLEHRTGLIQVWMVDDSALSTVRSLVEHQRDGGMGKVHNRLKAAKRAAPHQFADVPFTPSGRRKMLDVIDRNGLA